MTVAIGDFWNLAVESRLLSPADCQQWDAAFAHVKGAASQGNAATLGQWLVANGALSGYQVQTLLSGHAGPFLFGDYCVYDRIRSKAGRLAGLYRALHIGTRHPVLLCFLSSEIVRNPEAREAAARQLAWACWVGHPYVCECHQLLDLCAYQVAVIENLIGEPAGLRLTGGSPFAPQDACRVAYQAALGVGRMHQLGFAHGEIRPDNLWLTPDGSLKLLQAPLAPQPLEGPAPLDWANPSDKLLSAALYAAPELAQPGRPPDALSDVYALGATLFHLLSGAPPFAGSDPATVMARHAAEPVASLAALGIPPQLDQMIAYLMAKDPSQRYPQACQVAEGLAYFVDPAVANAPPPTQPTLPAYDEWLQQQSRVPGIAPGTIPTALQMAAYTGGQFSGGQFSGGQYPGGQYSAADYSAAQQAAEQQAAAQQAAAQQAALQSNGAGQQSPGENGYPAQSANLSYGNGQFAAPAAPVYFDPAANAPPRPESFAAPAPEPLAYIPADPQRQQFDFGRVDLSSAGSRATTENMLDNLAARSAPSPAASSAGLNPTPPNFAAARVAGPATTGSAATGSAVSGPATAGPATTGPATIGIDADGIDFSTQQALDEGAVATAPALRELDAFIASTPKTSRPKHVGTRRPTRRTDLLTFGIIGGALGVAVIVGVVMVLHMNGPRNPSNENLAGLTNPPGQGSEPGSAAAGGASGGSASTTATGTKPIPKPRPVGPSGDLPPDSKKPARTNFIDTPPRSELSRAVADDGKSLWASPTSGPPLSMKYVASGAQVVLAIRPANIVRRPDGDQIVPALGPWGPSAELLLKTLSGRDLGQIDQVMAVWHDPGNGQLTPTLIVRTQEKLEPAALLPAWGNPAAVKQGGETFYQGPVWCYYLPAKEEGKCLVVAHADQIKEIIDAGGQTIAMAGHLERILKDSDRDRDVTLAFVRSSLFGGRQAFFDGEMGALRKPAEAFFGDDVKSALVSLHFNGNLFVELRILGSADKSADALASQFANRARSLPDLVENALVDLNPHRYARKLLLRFPEQLRALAEETRSGVDDDMALLRCYLPPVASHNLIMASELALAEQPMSGGPAGGAEKNLSVAELLKKKTTLTFPRDTLEKSLQMLFDDIGVKYEILGGDLQLEGITKNQSFGLDEKNKTAGEILRKIMHLANPDGKLIYIIKPKQPGGPEMLFITTRASAAKRGDKLPPELAASTPPKKKRP